MYSSDDMASSVSFISSLKPFVLVTNKIDEKDVYIHTASVVSDTPAAQESRKATRVSSTSLSDKACAYREIEGITDAV